MSLLKGMNKQKLYLPVHDGKFPMNPNEPFCWHETDWGPFKLKPSLHVKFTVELKSWSVLLGLIRSMSSCWNVGRLHFTSVKIYIHTNY